MRHLNHLISRFKKYFVASGYSNVTRNVDILVSRRRGRSVIARRGMTTNHSTSTKPLVGIISQYFIDQAGMDKLTERCSSASFVMIEYTGR